MNKWTICHRCDGEGKHSHHLGAISMDTFDEDPEYKEAYMSGGYDMPCVNCEGTGKVISK